MSEPTHVFVGVRHGRVFAIAATVETVSTWLEEEGADLIQRVPLAEARTLLFQPLPMLAEIDTLRAENERLEAEVERLSRLATDNAYMRDAYHAMLMPNGLKVAAMWKAKGVRRQHTSWGDNAWLLTGEERAQCILDWEALPRREVLPGELDGPALSEAQP